MPSRESGLPAPHPNSFNPWPRRFVALLAIAAGAVGGTYAETQYHVYEAGFKAAGLKNPFTPPTWPHRLPATTIPRPALPQLPEKPSLPTLPPRPTVPIFQDSN